jgi:hypothetical protein
MGLVSMTATSEAAIMAITKPKKKRWGRQKAKRGQITLAGGETVAQRATGRDRRHTNQREPDARQTVAHARARRAGVDPSDAVDAIFGDDLCICIAAMVAGQQDRANLEQTYRHISASKRNWEQRIIGASPHPQSASLPMLSEPMQTDESATVDLRDADERDIAARNSWYAWMEDLMKLPGEQRHALRGWIDGYGLTLWDEANRHPTRAGALAVKALRSLHDARAG